MIGASWTLAGAPYLSNIERSCRPCPARIVACRPRRPSRADDHDCCVQAKQTWRRGAGELAVSTPIATEGPRGCSCARRPAARTLLGLRRWTEQRRITSHGASEARCPSFEGRGVGARVRPPRSGGMLSRGTPSAARLGDRRGAVQARLCLAGHRIAAGRAICVSRQRELWSVERYEATRLHLGELGRVIARVASCRPSSGESSARGSASGSGT
jgi:hypothetical protein